MALGSDKKTYAEAVISSSSFGVHSLSHLQTQDEEEALVIAIQRSLSSTQSDLANIDHDSNKEFKRPSEVFTKRVKVKTHRIKTFESWEAEEFNPGVPRLPLGRYTYREYFTEAQRKEAIVTKRSAAKKKKRTEKQKRVEEKIKCPPKLGRDNIPGTFKSPMIPEGLRSNRGTVANGTQGGSSGRDNASKVFSDNSCVKETSPQTKEKNNRIRIAAGSVAWEPCVKVLANEDT